MKIEVNLTDSHFILIDSILNKHRGSGETPLTNDEILENPKTAAAIIDEIVLRASQFDGLKEQNKKLKSKKTGSSDKKEFKKAQRELKDQLKGKSVGTKKTSKKKKASSNKSESQAGE
jgi:hypothetical protein